MKFPAKRSACFIVSSFKNEQVFFNHPESGARFSILNISLNGIALLKPAEASIPSSDGWQGEFVAEKQSIKAMFFPPIRMKTFSGAR